MGMAFRTYDDLFFDWMCREQQLSDALLSAFSKTAPCLLNRLPVSLKELNSIATFKSTLTIFLLAGACDLSDRRMNEGYKL